MVITIALNAVRNKEQSYYWGLN